jgi:hypothetical protein
VKGGPDQQQQKVVMDKIEMNASVADSSFTMPAVAAKPDSAAAPAADKSADAKTATKTTKKK